MDILMLFLVFALGLIVGSFLNVVIFRYNTGMTLRGRSQCFSCGKNLSWSELIPLFSYLFLAGRCRFCKSRISIQYPLVELATGTVFVWLLLTFGLTPLFFYGAVLASLLLVIVVYDVRHKIIPDGIVYTLIVLAALSLFIGPNLELTVPSLPELINGPLLAAPFALLWLMSGGKWMGLGDAKLALGIGWLITPSQALLLFLLSFWIGAGVSLAIIGAHYVIKRSRLLSSSGRLTIKSEIPFAPFLVVALIIIVAAGIDFFDMLPI